MKTLKILLVTWGVLFLNTLMITAQNYKERNKIKHESFEVYRTNSYTLFSDKIIEGDNMAFVQKKSIVNSLQEHIVPDLEYDYPILETELPIVNEMYKLSLNDLELCNVDNHHFRISPDFPRNAYYTRDVAYSSTLGACFTNTNLIKKHLKIVREQRKEIGYKCPKTHIVPYLGELNEVTNIPLSNDYDNACIAKRTDDICWVIGYYDALCIDGSKSDFEWLIQEFDFFDKFYYQYFRDSETGLYRGQSTFIDIAGTGYPKEFNFQKSITIKALSTNCLYVRAFDCLEKTALHTGNTQKAKEFSKRKSEIKDLILKNFLHPDGYYAYFIHEDGSFEERRETMGMAFLVLFDILDKQDFETALGNYPSNDYGNPLFWPFYPDTKTYHNKAIWPFANTFYNWAQFKHKREDEVVLRMLGNLSRNLLWGNFTEIMDYETGGKEYKHARSYIWSAASYLTLIYKVLAGIDFDNPETITINPYLPEVFKGKFQLKNITFGDTSIDLIVTGQGGQFKSVKIDGKLTDKNSLKKDNKHHLIEIEVTI